MKDIIRQLEERQVKTNNFLRLEMSNQIDTLIQSSDFLKVSKFLKLTMDLSLISMIEIFHRVNSGEKFMDVTNDLNKRKLL